MRFLIWGLLWVYPSALAQTAKSALEWFESAVSSMYGRQSQSARGMKFHRDKAAPEGTAVYRFEKDNPAEVAGRSVWFIQGHCVSDAKVGLPHYRERLRHKGRKNPCFYVTTVDLSRFTDLVEASLVGGQTAPKPQDNAICEQWQSALPPDYHRIDVELVAGEGHELPQNFQIVDDIYSGGITYHTMLNVHHADKPVVLVLNSYYPNVWDMGYSGQTNIVAVYITGYHQSTIIGLPEHSRMVRHTYDMPTCREAYGNAPRGLLPAAEQLKLTRNSPQGFEKPIILGEDVGSWVRTGDLNSVRKQGQLAGKAGIQQLVEQGALQPMTHALREAFFNVPMVERTHNNSAIIGYWVRKPIDLPAEMYGGFSTYFYVPDDVPLPRGDFAHNTFYLPSGLCWGVGCPE